MIIFIVKLIVSPTDRKNAINVFDAVSGSTSVKPGCKMVELQSDVHNDDNLILIEKWDSMAELEKHISSDEFRKIMAIMEMAVEQPEVFFHTVSSTMGFELVKKIRNNVNM
ncbi:putative quinol monooxygenase [Thermodesulfobacteriota bacterium]